jgi:hypothetical protein
MFHRPVWMVHHHIASRANLLRMADRMHLDRIPQLLVPIAEHAPVSIGHRPDFSDRRHPAIASLVRPFARVSRAVPTLGSSSFITELYRAQSLHLARRTSEWGAMSQSAPNDELSRLEAQMKELLAESEVIQQRIAELKGQVHGVVDDSVLITSAEIVSDGHSNPSEQR